jgi:hypothetical protein
MRVSAMRSNSSGDCLMIFLIVPFDRAPTVIRMFLDVRGRFSFYQETWELLSLEVGENNNLREGLAS